MKQKRETLDKQDVRESLIEDMRYWLTEAKKYDQNSENHYVSDDHYNRRAMYHAVALTMQHIYPKQEVYVEMVKAEMDIFGQEIMAHARQPI